MNSDLPPVIESTNQTKSPLSSNLLTVALLIIVVLQSFALFYFFYKGNKSDNSSEIPVSYLPDKKATNVGVSNVVAPPTLEDLPSPDSFNGSDFTDIDLKGVIDNYCKPTSYGTHYINIEDIPLDLSGVVIDFTNSPPIADNSVPCYPFDYESGGAVGYIVIPVVDLPNIYIHGLSSQEGDHGGLFWFSNLIPFYASSNIEYSWSLDWPEGGFCSTVDYKEVSPVVLRGRSSISNYKGDSLYLTTDRLAINNEDPRLIKTFEYFLDCGKGYQFAKDEIEKVISQEFFASSGSLQGSEKKAYDELTEVLNSIVLK